LGTTLELRLTVAMGARLARSSGGLLLVVGVGKIVCVKMHVLATRKPRSACGYNRDVEGNFHIAVQKRISFVTKDVCTN